MVDDYERRFAAAMQEMAAAGIRNWNAVPPYVRLGRRLGMRLRPPYYLPAATVVAGFGALFFVLYGGLMLATTWRHGGMSPGTMLLIDAGVAIGFGGMMAVFYGWRRRQHGLSAWETL